MKKSQILAALALAFALGVVAPVAGTYAIVHDDVNTVTDEGAATYDEVQTVIGAVESDTVYQNVLHAESELNKLTATPPATVAEYRDLSTGNIGGIVWSFTTNAAGVPAAAANTEMASLISDYNNGTLSASNPEDFQKMVTAATKTTGYKEYTALFTALKDANHTGLAEAILGINRLVWGNNTGAYFAYNATALNSYTNVTTNPIASDAATSTAYAWFLDLSTSVDRAQSAINSYKAGLKGITEALFAEGVLSATDADALEASLQATPYPTLASLNTTYSSKIQNKTQWDAVTTALDNAKKSTKQTSAGTNYDRIIALAHAYGVVTNLTKSMTDAQIADELLKYKAPVNNPDEPNNGDTNNGDDTQDPSAPGTGLVSTAEGNAATTVSIVAGLATALTALGAGVVAYRSARRSNK